MGGLTWIMLQRFKIAMVGADRTHFSGTVEVDETLVVGVDHGGKQGRGTSKSSVLIAFEVLDPKGFGRVRMCHVPEASSASLLPFIWAAANPGTAIHTDGWSGYRVLSGTWVYPHQDGFEFLG